MTVKLRCPHCDVKGEEYLRLGYLSREVAQIYCGNCGAIHGAVPKPTGTVLPTVSLSRLPTEVEVTPKRPVMSSMAAAKVSTTVNPISPTTKSPEPVSSSPIETIVKSNSPTAKSLEPILSPLTTKLITSSTLPNDWPQFLEMAEGDLVAKRQQYEAQLSVRAQQARKSSSNYFIVQIDEGPPYCLTCEVNMEEVLIPEGYKNSGQVVWVCPKQCGNWEAS